MNDITITIDGPGGVINYEYYVILAALQNAGVVVIEDNDCQDHDYSERHNMTRKRIESGRLTVTVKLVANHMPWGG